MTSKIMKAEVGNIDYVNIDTYVRLKVKKLKSIDFISSTAVICATLLIDFNTEGLTKEQINTIFFNPSKRIKVYFNDEDKKLLQESEDVTMKYK